MKSAVSDLNYGLRFVQSVRISLKHTRISTGAPLPASIYAWTKLRPVDTERVDAGRRAPNHAVFNFWTRWLVRILLAANQQPYRCSYIFIIIRRGRRIARL